MTEKKLFRVHEGAFAGGVCAGLADYYEMDTIIVRILAILITVLTFGLGAIAYLALWANIPLEPERSTPYDIMPESAESSAFGCVDCSPNISECRKSGIPVLARLAVAAGLMLLFLTVSMGVSPLMPGTNWWQFWPLCFLMAGLCLIVIPIRTRYEGVWHSAGIALTSLAASALPMSLGIMSWNTVGNAFLALWPFILAAVVLFGIGLHRKRNAYLIGASFCLVIFCVLGLMLCAVPGDLEMLLFNSPTGRMFKFEIIC